MFVKRAIQTTLFYVSMLVLVISSMTAGGCAARQGNSRVDFRCVLQDERVGAPFTDPARAREWLRSTKDYLIEIAQRIQAREFTPTQEDIKRFADLADLVKRAQSCLE